jgi:hypothetical protein
MHLIELSRTSFSKDTSCCSCVHGDITSGLSCNMLFNVMTPSTSRVMMYIAFIDFSCVLPLTPCCLEHNHQYGQEIIEDIWQTKYHIHRSHVPHTEFKRSCLSQSFDLERARNTTLILTLLVILTSVLLSPRRTLPSHCTFLSRQALD